MIFLSSYKFTGILLTLTAIILAAATFIENSTSSVIAKNLVYHNPLFFILGFFMIVNFISIIFTKNYIKAKRYGMIFLHLAFVFILSGAFITHIWGIEGLVHIRQGESSNILINNSSEKTGELPFSITLDEFIMEKYSDLGSPSSYESFITINNQKYHVYMNGFAKYNHYRIYQSSYDKDLRGTVLSISYDPWGITITYIGYIMLLLGFILAFIDKKSRFRTLLQKIAIVTILVIFNNSGYSQNMEQIKKEALQYSTMYAVPDSIATEFSHLTIQTIQGRLEPVDTYSKDILQKLSKNKHSFNGLNRNQVLMGICTQQAIWTYVPFIYVNNPDIIDALSLPVDTKRISYSDVFNKQGEYILEKHINDIYEKDPSQRNGTDKDFIKLDERLNILSSLFSNEALRMFPLSRTRSWYSPKDNLNKFETMDSVFASNAFAYLSNSINSTIQEGNGDWEKSSQIISALKQYQIKKGGPNNLTENKIKAEIFYNNLNAIQITGYGYMTIGLLLIVFSLISLLSKSKYKQFTNVLTGISLVLFLLLTLNIGLRWYISGNAPWSNAYESIIFVAWATALIGLSIKRRFEIIFALSTFFAGALLFVSNLSFMDPQITPLVPVLKSYWLIIHVATITASYGFFGVSALIGLITVILYAFNPGITIVKYSEIKRLTYANELLLWIGLALMTIGTFLGAVWANQSWGRYWGWDPKETWALITVIVYTIVLHSRLIFKNNHELMFSIMSVYALTSVLMTFFGVNYYFSGLHSYAGGSESIPLLLLIIYIIYACVTIICFISIYRLPSEEIDKRI